MLPPWKTGAVRRSRSLSILEYDTVSEKLTDVIERVWTLTRDKKYVWKKRAKSGEGIGFLLDFLQLPVEIYQCLPQTFRGSTIPWPRIFHTRMRCSQGILSQEKIDTFAECIQALLECEGALTRPQRDSAETLADYLLTHALDPDNALIGVQASRLVADEVAVSPPLQLSEGQTVPDGVTAQSLLDTIRQWALLSDRDLVIEVRQFADSVAIKAIRRGALLVVKVPEGKLLFARSMTTQSADSGDNLSVSIDPNEWGSPSFNISPKDVAIFPPKLVPMLGSLRGLQHLTCDPCSDLLQEVSSDIRSLIQNVLKDSGLDTELTSKVEMEHYTQADLQNIETALGRLRKLEQSQEIDILPGILSETTALVSKKVAPFLGSLDERQLLSLTAAASIKQLTETDFSKIATSVLKLSIQTKIKATVAASESLKAERLDILSGDKKRQLTDFYLGLIRAKVDSFLMEKGYDFNAVPVNYLDQPPKDIALVRQNATILKDHLSPSEGKRSAELEALICGLRHVIYEQLDEFVEKAIAVLCDTLGLNLPEFSFDLAQAALDKYAGDKKVKQQVTDLLKDMKYIERMKELETAEKTNCLDVVPLTGLIISRLMRVNNEQQTVLSVWGSSTAAATSSSATTTPTARRPSLSSRSPEAPKPPSSPKQAPEDPK